MSGRAESIILGSGDLYFGEYTKEMELTMQVITGIATDANKIGGISGGASVEYKPTYVSQKDDLGRIEKTIITEEEAKMKSGIMTINADNINKLCTTGTVTTNEEEGTKTVKIGGISKQTGKSYIIIFKHTDPTDGDIYIAIRGQNQAGFTLSFQKDKATVIDAEFKCLPQDEEGTLITYIEVTPKG